MSLTIETPLNRKVSFRSAAPIGRWPFTGNVRVKLEDSVNFARSSHRKAVREAIKALTPESLATQRWSEKKDPRLKLRDVIDKANKTGTVSITIRIFLLPSTEEDPIKKMVSIEFAGRNETFRFTREFQDQVTKS